MFRWQTNFYIIGEILKIDKRERLGGQGCQGYLQGAGGIIVPIMMIVMMDVVTRPWHYGTGGYTGNATAASTPPLISVVVATPSWPHPHTTARPLASG